MGICFRKVRCACLLIHQVFLTIAFVNLAARPEQMAVCQGTRTLAANGHSQARAAARVPDE